MRALVRAFRFIASFIALVALGAAALGGGLALLVPAGAQYSSSTKYGALLPAMNKEALRSYVYDSRGGVMTTLYDEDRQPVKLSEVPPVLIHAVLSIEDRRFYEHDGVDYEGTARALFKNVDAGEIQQGGSTITQQLVKNTMSDPKKRDLKTKIREAVLAVRLENEMSKNEILERYLNIVYLGNGAYGVKAAAERYFNITDLKRLTLGQASLLAGLIQSPEGLNPISYPDRAARRRVEVLDAMIDTKAITPQQARLAREEPLPTKIYTTNTSRDAVTQQIVDLLTHDPSSPSDPAAYLGANPTERYDALFRGGLRIYTSYDPLMQLIAKQAVDDILPADRDPEITAAVVVIDNATGGVRAMYLGRDFKDSQYNPITQAGRQTGSSFKAITLATALEAGYSPKDSVSGANFTIHIKGQADHTLKCEGDTPTIAKATAESNNCSFTRILESLGPGHYGSDGAERVISMAARLGIDASKLKAVPSLTLGTSNTNVLDMAEAYSTFANDGIHRNPIFVTKIEAPDGKVLYQADTTGQRVLSDQVARTETDVLKGVIKDGTGTRANIGRPAAGKTGTTDNRTDAWFVGYTPQFTTAVWMGGYSTTSVHMYNVGGINVQGGTYPARIWAQVMRGATNGMPELDFPAPDQGLWPSARRVDEFGRAVSGSAASSGTRRHRSTSTTAPAAPPSSVATTPVPPPVTAPPATHPAVPPGQNKNPKPPGNGQGP
jgi:penicillin-binding protein 1A